MSVRAAREMEAKRPRVARSEASLLHAVRLVLGRASRSELEAALPPVEASPRGRDDAVSSLEIGDPSTRPETGVGLDAGIRLGPTATGLLESDLRRGLPRALMRRGAVRRGRFFVGGASEEGRWIDVHPPIALPLSKASYALAIWLGYGGAFNERPRTVGDELFFYLAADALDRVGRSTAPLHRSALVCLAHAANVHEAPRRDRFEELLAEPRRTLLSALEPELSRRWITMETWKGRFRATAPLIEHAERQASVLGAYLDAIEHSGDRRAATFLIDAACNLSGRPPSSWVRGLRDAKVPLQERSAAARAAASTLRIFNRLATAYETEAAVRFFDDGYDAAQWLVDRWDALGRAGFERLRGNADALESWRGLEDTESSDPASSAGEPAKAGLE